MFIYQIEHLVDINNNMRCSDSPFIALKWYRVINKNRKKMGKDKDGVRTGEENCNILSVWQERYTNTGYQEGLSREWFS